MTSCGKITRHNSFQVATFWVDFLPNNASSIPAVILSSGSLGSKEITGSQIWSIGKSMCVRNSSTVANSPMH